MLYLTKPIGGGGGAGSMRPKFGFRIDQVRMTGNSGAPDAGDPMQHRPLVNWQMDGLRGMHAQDMRVVLGGRLSYDVTHGGFGPSGGRPAMTLTPQAAAGARAPNFTESKPFETRRFSEPGRWGHESLGFGFGETREHAESASGLREVAAAAIATFKSHVTSNPPHPFAMGPRGQALVAMRPAN